MFEQQKAQIEAQIAVVRAKGEAESISIRGEALAQNPELIDLEIVRKWNGRAPRVVGGEAGGAKMILPLNRESTGPQSDSAAIQKEAKR